MVHREVGKLEIDRARIRFKRWRAKWTTSFRVLLRLALIERESTSILTPEDLHNSTISMAQTLMAFLAMMIATLAAINQYRSQIQSYSDTIRSEYELMANALVLEQMEIIDMTTDYDDLDDWDGDEITLDYGIGDSDIEFDIEISVDFVDDDGEISLSETDQKQITITGTHESIAATLVSHTRIIADDD